MMARCLAEMLVLAAAVAGAEPRAAEVAKALRGLELDETQCFRVRELNFQKEDAKFYLTEGYLIFSKPVAGMPVAMAFTAEVESGEAELLLMPPLRSERASLASFTKSPNLAERIRQAIFLTSDDTAAMLREQVAKAEVPFRQSTEMGLVLKQRFEAAARNLAGSFEVRMVWDLLAEQRREKGFFYAALGGASLGNFDVFVDQRGRQMVTVGQLVTKADGSAFDTWTQFEGRSRRQKAGGARGVAWDPRLEDFRLETTVFPDLHIETVTRVKALVGRAGDGALPFEISPRVRITAATVDGEPAEVFQRESLRSTLMAGGQNELVLVVPARRLEAGRSYEVELKSEGTVIREAGNGVYFVGARANWYPQRGLQPARYDARFRYPKALTLVSAGEAVEEGVEGEWRVSRWRTPVAVRLLGFNLGRFEKSSQTRGGYRVDVYANRELEGGGGRAPLMGPPVVGPVGGRGARRTEPGVLLPPAAPPPSPLARLEKMAAEMGEALEFMTVRLGAPPLQTVNVTPIPGRFGQGFPGLLYVSTLNYLSPDAQAAVTRTEGSLYFELLQAHEVAHQWWGNLVTPEAVEDEWWMEALANYTAMLYLEKRRGGRAVDGLLDRYRQRLLAEGEDGKVVEGAGPIVWGGRLSTSALPQAWQTITYEKGSWILHMLRRRMGDVAFTQLLGELTRRFAQAPLSNEEVARVAAGLMPAGAGKTAVAAFFDTWIYGTGVPELKLQHKVAGGRVTGTVTQTGVDEDFTAEVPVEIQWGRGRTVTHWVRTSAEGAEFAVPVPAGVVAAQVKVALDPGGWVLRR